MNSSSSRENIFPVGLFGVLTIIAFVLGPNARVNSSRSKLQSGGRSCTNRGAAPASISSPHQPRHHRFGRAAANGDFPLGIDAHSLRALEFARDGVAQLLRAPGDVVLIDVVGNSLAGSFLHFRGG